MTATQLLIRESGQGGEGDNPHCHFDRGSVGDRVEKSIRLATLAQDRFWGLSAARYMKPPPRFLDYGVALLRLRSK